MISVHSTTGEGMYKILEISSSQLVGMEKSDFMMIALAIKRDQRGTP